MAIAHHSTYPLILRTFYILTKAVEAGATIIDTCVGAFAEGASHPTTQSLVAALAGTAYDTGLSLPLIEEISAYFKEVRKKYWQFESAFTGTDTRVLINQVPGGMISNLANQLKEQGALDSMDAVLAVDSDMNVRFANNEAERLFQRTRDQMAGRPFVWAMPNEEVVGALRASVYEGRRDVRVVERPNRQFLQAVSSPIGAAESGPRLSFSTTSAT